VDPHTIDDIMLGRAQPAGEAHALVSAGAAAEPGHDHPDRY
jgi:hypothetical protein